jgi:hypothetical protein
MNPFNNRLSSQSGTAADIPPVKPNDAPNLLNVVFALYVENGSRIVFDTITGETQYAWPTFGHVGRRRSGALDRGIATGTHALVLA